MTDHTDISRKIVEDMNARAPFDGYTTVPSRTVVEAYAIQDAVTRTLLEDGHRSGLAGWKIAANSPMLMDKFKLTEPATGRVFEDQRHESPATLPAADFGQFAFEPEIAAIMSDTLDPADAPFDRQTVLAAIERFVPAMELLDMRNIDMPTAHIPDAIAQNISNAGVVLGGPGVPADTLDETTVRTVLTIDGSVDHDVTGAAPQSPVAAVTWIANHLAARGLSLEAGQIVLCGTHSPIWFHEGTGEIKVEMSALGDVSLTLE